MEDIVALLPNTKQKFYWWIFCCAAIFPVVAGICHALGGQWHLVRSTRWFFALHALNGLSFPLFLAAALSLPMPSFTNVLGEDTVRFFISVAGIIGIMAVAASLLPAVRARRVDGVVENQGNGRYRASVSFNSQDL